MSENLKRAGLVQLTASVEFRKSIDALNRISTLLETQLKQLNTQVQLMNINTEANIGLLKAVRLQTDAMIDSFELITVSIRSFAFLFDELGNKLFEIGFRDIGKAIGDSTNWFKLMNDALGDVFQTIKTTAGQDISMKPTKPSFTPTGKGGLPISAKDVKAQGKFMKGLGKMSAKMSLASIALEAIDVTIKAFLEPIQALMPIFEMFGTQFSTLLIPLIPPLVDAFMALTPEITATIETLMPVMTALASGLQLLANLMPGFMIPMTLYFEALSVVTGAIFGVVESILNWTSIMVEWGDKIDNLGIWDSFDTGKGAIRDWVAEMKEGTEITRANNRARDEELDAIAAHTEAMLLLTVAEGGISTRGGITGAPIR